MCGHMLRPSGLTELGFPHLRRHVDVSNGAPQSATEFLCELGHRQRLRAGEVVDLADMRLWVDQHRSRGSPHVGGCDRRGLPIGEWEADDVVVTDTLGRLQQEDLQESGWPQ